MSSVLENRLEKIINSQAVAALQSSLIGLEKECLRVNNQGNISQSAHPEKLGSALTHPYITTDYSEALLEFITPPYKSVDDALAFLCDTQ
ncbi:Glutamate--cysteine ligase, partial [hydrothermal vent metagenome]